MAKVRNLGLPKVSRMSVIIGTLAVILGLVLASQGVVQTFATTLEVSPLDQSITSAGGAPTRRRRR